MADLLADVRHEFKRYKSLADRAISTLDDAAFFHRPADAVNSIALIVKHVAGNLASRWTDFLTTDGEKPTRDRDGEFLLRDADTRASLLAAWERGWGILFATLDTLTAADLDKTITIRGEAQSAQQALLRNNAHVAYHVGQVLYLIRMLKPDSPWLTIAPGQSNGFPGNYRKA